MTAPGDKPPFVLSDDEIAAIRAEAAAEEELNGAGEYDDYDEEDDVELDESDPRVAAALAQIDAMFGRPPAEQVAAFTEAHHALQATLASIDDN